MRTRLQKWSYAVLFPTLISSLLVAFLITWSSGFRGDVHPNRHRAVAAYINRKGGTSVPEAEPIIDAQSRRLLLLLQNKLFDSMTLTPLRGGANQHRRCGDNCRALDLEKRKPILNRIRLNPLVFEFDHDHFWLWLKLKKLLGRAVWLDASTDRAQHPLFYAFTFLTWTCRTWNFLSFSSWTV